MGEAIEAVFSRTSTMRIPPSYGRPPRGAADGPAGPRAGAGERPGRRSAACYALPVTRVECLGCGHVLDLPPSVVEGGEFACAHCGLLMRNVEAARAFRWADVDPYVRRHGASRANLWGGLGGSVL